jgi:prolyl oligopeptidase
MTALLAGAAPAFAALPPPPVAKEIPVVDDYFGTKVVDPYRWMEQPGSADLAAYLKAQNDRTRAILDSIPERAALAARIRSLAETINASTDVTRRHGRLFYEKLIPGSNISKLYVREGVGGQERILVDPDAFAPPGHHKAISYYAPSDDGSFVAVGLSADGSEDAVIRIFETATGRTLPETIDRARSGVTSWRGDGRAFYYIRLQVVPPGAPPTEKYRNQRTYLHLLGADPKNDAAVFGIGLSPEVPVNPVETAIAVVDPGSPYALGIIREGVRREIEIYVAPKGALDSGKAPWRKIAGCEDQVTGLDFRGSKLFLVSHKDAPRFKVIEVDAEHPDLAGAKVLIPPGERVVESMGAARDALYVRSLEDGLGRITRIGWDGARSEIPLPFDGTLSGMDTQSDSPGFIIRLEGWIVSPLWYAYDPAARSLADTRLDPPSSVDFSNITTEEVKVRASDGVMVPLSLIHPKSLRLDGSNPTLLYAYGSYGINSSPTFSPVRLAWYERGGVYAIAHVRGGGEYGEEWHLAGKGANKLKTITDTIDCARWLIDRGYSSPEKLGGRGGSAGGIVMGGLIARAPELFAAILDEIPVSDQLRIELTANGPPNVPEFGSVRTLQGFKALYATSPVHHLRPGGKYPAVMLMTGSNDPRVDPWQAAKMAATLQADSASGKPILLRVDYAGGHGLIGATKSQAADTAADEYSFLLWNMGVQGFQPGIRKL